MSLIAWYPLLGNENNQGLDGTNLEVMGTVPYNAGKIGNAATFSGVAANCLHRPSFNLTDNFTWACWVKITNTVSTYQFILSEGRDYEKYGMSLITFTNGSIGLMYGTNSTLVILSSPVLNTWYHITVVVSSTEGIKGYVNGALAVTGSYKVPDYTYNSNRFTIGKMSYTYTNTTSYFPLNGQVNDVRIYNHCLSAKEVKEISKGLVLHYPLHGGEGGANLFKGSKEYYATSSGITEIGSSLTYDTSILPLNSLIGKTVTFTFDYSVVGEKLNTSGGWSKQRFGAHLTVEYVDSAGATVTTYPCTGHLHEGVTGEGTGRAVQTYTFPTNWQSITSFRISPGPQNQPSANNTATWYMKNFKVELGNVDTGYSVNPNEVGNIGHMPDRAGYNHHGAVAGILTYNSDSPRHNISAHIEGTDQINLFNLPYESIDNGTLSFWIKINKFKGWSHYVFIADAFNWTGTERDFIIVANNREEATEVSTANVVLDCCSYTSSHSMTINQWYHITFTWDAKNYIIKKYINGNCVYTHDDSSNKRLNVYRLKHGVRRIGAGGTSTSYYGNYNISDFRVYSTTMSESDIKELYQIPISIDKSGNAFSMEFIEDQKPEFHKNGIIEASDFYENLIFHDMEFKTLSDGSLWARILHHNNKGGTVLFTKDNAINYQSADLYSRLYALEGYRNVDGKFEFMAIQPDLDANKIYRWKQSNNPVTDSAIAGYENITNGQGGLVKCSNSTYCAVSPTNSNWWCAVGCYTAFQGGIPGFGGNVVTGTLDLYVRIPTINKTSIYKKQYIASNQIIEV